MTRLLLLQLFSVGVLACDRTTLHPKGSSVVRTCAVPEAHQDSVSICSSFAGSGPAKTPAQRRNAFLLSPYVSGFTFPV